MNLTLIALIFQYSTEYGVSPNLVQGIITVESSWNVKAVGSVGEVGLMQIRPHYYKKYSKEQLFKPSINLRLGIKHLANAFKHCKHKGEYVELVCYNRGVAGGSKLKRPKSTTYYQRVIAAMPETRFKLAVIDTGITITPEIAPYICKNGSKDFTGKGLSDVSGHGSNIAGIIAQRVSSDTHCLLILKWYHDEETRSIAGISTAIFYAMSQNASIINMSLAGDGYLAEEQKAIQKALDKGIIVVVAAGNDNKNLSMSCPIYPTCYKMASANFHVVGNWSSEGNSRSNYGSPITDVENGNNITAGGVTLSGSSQAAAKLSAYYASKLSVTRKLGI